jgi:hypothetical protein
MAYQQNSNGSNYVFEVSDGMTNIVYVDRHPEISMLAKNRSKCNSALDARSCKIPMVVPMFSDQ